MLFLTLDNDVRLGKTLPPVTAPLPSMQSKWEISPLSACFVYLRLGYFLCLKYLIPLAEMWFVGSPLGEGFLQGLPLRLAVTVAGQSCWSLVTSGKLTVFCNRLGFLLSVKWGPRCLAAPRSISGNSQSSHPWQKFPQQNRCGQFQRWNVSSP